MLAAIWFSKPDAATQRHCCRWVQHRGATEDIGFHHDKDEGMASIKSTMKFPEVRPRSRGMGG